MRIAMFLIALSAAAVNAASFDCAKARSETEKMICGDAVLTNLAGFLSQLKATAEHAVNPGILQHQFCRGFARIIPETSLVDRVVDNIVNSVSGSMRG